MGSPYSWTMHEYTAMEPEEVEKVLVTHLRDNQVLREGPRPWTIRYSPLGGRGMFATRDIEQGELIFVDSPLLIGPRCGKKHLPMCVSCYKTDCPLFPCDHGCGLPVCSEQCENSPKHVSFECQYLKALVPTCGTDWSMDLLQTVVPIRALFLSDAQRNCLSMIEYHGALPNDYELNLLLHNVKNLPSEDDVKLMKRVCGAFNTGSFETVAIDSAGRSASLRALYPMGALQNHCCVPKTRHHFDENFRLYVYAALPVSAGEELTMVYTSLFWDTALRRLFLSSTKSFSCNCHRCSDPTELGSRLGALMCAVDGCNGDLLPVNPLDYDSFWICDRCAIKVNCRQIRSIRSGLAAIIEENLSKNPRQILKFMRTELATLLPASNYLMMNMKFRIVSYFGRIEGLQWADLSDSELDTKVTYCNDLLSTLDTLNCGDCKKRGLILYELYCTNLERIKRLHQLREKQEDLNSECNNRLLEKALSIFQNDVATADIQENMRAVSNEI